MRPFLVHDGPVAFAHRGEAGAAPENELVAFELAMTLGFSYLENDATSGATARWSPSTTTTWTASPIADVMSADAGYTFSPDGGGRSPFRGRGVRVPRLEHLLVTGPTSPPTVYRCRSVADVSES